MIERRDRPIVLALCLVALSLVATPLLSRLAPPQQQPANKSAKEKTEKPFWEDISLEAFFTGAIAIFAFAQVRDARQSAERQTRAYVVVKAEKIHDLEEGKIPWLEFSIKNVGQTPAYQYTHNSNIGFGPTPVTGPFPEVKINPKVRSPLNPGVDSLGKCTGDNAWLKMTKDQIALIEAGRAALVFVGRVEFVDIFGRDRWVKFCFYTGGKTLSSIIVHGQGNETSEDAALKQTPWYWPS